MEVCHHELELSTEGHGNVYDRDLEPRQRRVGLSFIGSVGGGG